MKWSQNPGMEKLAVQGATNAIALTMMKETDARAEMDVTAEVMRVISVCVGGEQAVMMVALESVIGRKSAEAGSEKRKTGAMIAVEMRRDGSAMPERLGVEVATTASTVPTTGVADIVGAAQTTAPVNDLQSVGTAGAGTIILGTAAQIARK